MEGRRGRQSLSTSSRRPCARRSPLCLHALLETLEEAGATVRCKVQPPVAPGGRFSKADFAIDLVTRTVTCPAGAIAPLRRADRPQGPVIEAAARPSVHLTPTIG